MVSKARRGTGVAGCIACPWARVCAGIGIMQRPECSIAKRESYSAITVAALMVQKPNDWSWFSRPCKDIECNVFRGALELFF